MDVYHFTIAPPKTLIKCYLGGIAVILGVSLYSLSNQIAIALIVALIIMVLLILYRGYYRMIKQYPIQLSYQQFDNSWLLTVANAEPQPVYIDSYLFITQQLLTVNCKPLNSGKNIPIIVVSKPSLSAGNLADLRRLLMVVRRH